jgi:hypothetical protein
MAPAMAAKEKCSEAKPRFGIQIAQQHENFMRPEAVR